MNIKEYLVKHWDIVKQVDEYTMDIYALNVCESLIKDLDKQDYNDLLNLINKKKLGIYNMEIEE